MNTIKNYITPLGFKRLQDEFDFLKKIERPEVTKLVSWAASLGDRSENADYIYGKKRLREIDRRLRFLGKRIGDASVVDPEKQNFDKIQFGATVEVENEDGESRIYSIVGVDETDSKRGLISWQSPIGKGLLGKKVGDSIEVRTPSGLVEFEVIIIHYKKIDIEEFVHDGPSTSQLR